MSHSKYESNRETTNLARVARIILGPCTDLLRYVLKTISPPDMKNKVKIFIANIPKNKRPINQNQKQIVLGGNYSDFDITLLYFLLRNICSLPPHGNQWGNDPSPGDKSVSANIERIRIIRNEFYGHATHFSLSDVDFQLKWNQLFEIVKELEGNFGTSTYHQDAVTEIKSCPMDQEAVKDYIERLLVVEKLQETVKSLEDKIERMEKATIPRNLKECYERSIIDWKKDDKVYLETHNFPAMLEKVRDQPFVTFVGVPGSGKTVTARHIALKLQEEGYEILPIKDIKDIETYCDPNNPQVFVIDDVIGFLGLDMAAFHMLSRYENLLKNPSMVKTKILMTCRKVVYKNETLSKSVLFKNDNVILLDSKENELNETDKCKLFELYQLDPSILTSTNLAFTSNMFPYLCKLFSTKEEYNAYGAKFFISPIPCILQVLDEMTIPEHRIRYASLVLLMANQNKLSEDIFDDDKITENKNNFLKMKCNFLKKCKVSNSTDTFQFYDALSEMEGTFTKKCGSEFTFIHDSMFEILAYHFGRLNPELMLEYMSSDYIANYIKVDMCKSKTKEGKNDEDKSEGSTQSSAVVEKDSVIDLCITLHKPHYPRLADRLFRDVVNGELYNVFGNEALKHPSVLHPFIRVIEGLSYSELHSVFLSELKGNIKKKRYDFDRYGVYEYDYIHINGLLLDERFVGCHDSKFLEQLAG